MQIFWLKKILIKIFSISENVSKRRRRKLCFSFRQGAIIIFQIIMGKKGWKGEKNIQFPFDFQISFFWFYPFKYKDHMNTTTTTIIIRKDSQISLIFEFLKEKKIVINKANDKVKKILTRSIYQSSIKTVFCTLPFYHNFDDLLFSPNLSVNDQIDWTKKKKQIQ